jgi:hypothetical protein
MPSVKIHKPDSKNALGVSLTQDDGIISIFNDEFTPDWNVPIRVEVIMLVVLDHCHHVLENLGADFERVHLGAVFEQSIASKLGYLLKVHILNTICELFIHYPEIFRKQLVTLVSVMKPS